MEKCAHIKLLAADPMGQEWE